jgi:hypothetical protein
MVRPKNQSQQCAAPGCSRLVPRKDRRRRGPGIKYCGPRCRQRAYRSRNAEPRISRFSTHDTAGVTNCEKSINSISELRRQNRDRASPNVRLPSRCSEVGRATQARYQRAFSERKRIMADKFSAIIETILLIILIFMYRPFITHKYAYIPAMDALSPGDTVIWHDTAHAYMPLPPIGTRDEVTAVHTANDGAIFISTRLAGPAGRPSAWYD